MSTRQKWEKELRGLIVVISLLVFLLFLSARNIVLAASPTNTLDGLGAGNSITSGAYNTFMGYKSGFENTSGQKNTFLGMNSGYSNTSGSYNTFMGYGSGSKNTTGFSNTFTGYGSGFKNTTGRDNTFSGMFSGFSNTTGLYNTFMGYGSGFKNTTGQKNTFSGMFSGYSNTSGSYNTFMGYGSGFKNTTGRDNTFSGMFSGFSNTTGLYNTFIGYRSGFENTTGSRNTFLGLYSGYNNSTGSGNVFLGFYAGFNEKGSNKLYIANSSSFPPLIYGDFEAGIVKINGTTETKVLVITGGSDLSEQFDISKPHIVKDNIKQDGFKIEPGMVVCIDPENPGKLLISNKAYDRTVAGIISGAGGVEPGMYMGQKGSIVDGKYPVALTGRVYCKADATYGPIQPGDLLTTSDTVGHVMKVSDYDRAHGAIIGKAMSSLEKDKGLVLVLVSLQ